MWTYFLDPKSPIDYIEELKLAKENLLLKINKTILEMTYTGYMWKDKFKMRQDKWYLFIETLLS